MSPESAVGRDEAAVALFVQRFAAALANSGWPRMPSRIFAALFAAESGALTSVELSEQLGISPAAVSGAVRFLSQSGFVSRERGPGSRRDHYRVHGEIWREAIAQRERLITSWKVELETGISAVGPDSAAGRRMAESVELLDFMQLETVNMMHRWRERCAETSPAPMGARNGGEAAAARSFTL